MSCHPEFYEWGREKCVEFCKSAAKISVTVLGSCGNDVYPGVGKKNEWVSQNAENGAHWVSYGLDTQGHWKAQLISTWFSALEDYKPAALFAWLASAFSSSAWKTKLVWKCTECRPSIFKGNTPKIFLGGVQPLSMLQPMGKQTLFTTLYPLIDHLSPIDPLHLLLTTPIYRAACMQSINQSINSRLL